MSDTVEVIILAKDQASKTIGGVRQALGGLGSVVGTVGRVGTAAFLGVGAAAVGGFGLALNAAIDMNASLEQSTMMFTTLMGDADMAAEHVAMLFDFAANTPFETGPIITASKHLQVFGGEALNTVENLTLIGDAAAAVGAPIDEVGFWIGRLYSNLQGGQPFGEAAMRLQELGIMSPQVRAEMEAMAEAGASGTAIFGEFQGAIGAFSGAMEMQSQSWVGLTSTIKDQLNLLMAEALRPFFDLAKQGLSELAAWLSSPQVQAGIQQLAAGFAALVQSVTDFVVNSVVPFVQQHGPELKAVVIGLAVAFGGLLIIGAVAAAIALLTNPITWIVAAIGALAAAWAADWGGIQTKTMAVVDFLRGLIQGFIENVRAWWDEHGAAIVAVAEKAWNLIQGVIDGVVKHIQLIIEAFKLAMEGRWEELGAKIFEIWENAWNTVIDFLRGLWDLIVPLFVSLWNSISGWFKSVDWASLGRNIVQGIINGVRAMGDALTGVLQGIVEAAIARIKQILGIASPSLLFEEIGVNIAQGLIEGIRSKQGEVFQTIEELVGTAGDLLGLASGFGGLFEQANIAPLEGGIAAIGEQIDAYTDSLQGMADTLGLTLNDPGIFLSLQQILNNPAATLAEKDTAAVMLAFLNERQQLTLEQIELERQLEEQQMALLRLEMQRQQLGFLQEQFNLLKLINENGLDPSILQGLTFGLDADPGAILEAMLGAMQSLVTVTAGELAAITPRTADRSIAGEFFGGVNRGGGVTVNIDARGAMNGVEREIRRVVEDVMREYGVRADIRMRT